MSYRLHLAATAAFSICTEIEDLRHQFPAMGSIVNISRKEKALDTVLTPSKVNDYLIDVCKDIKIFKQDIKLLHIWALASINFQSTISGEPSTL
jgi:predicted transglutaminase-like protease